MTDQPALFDVARTQPCPCRVPGCGAIRLPGQDQVPTCATDQQRATGDWVRRPKACLNQWDPTNAPFPEGY